MFSKCLSSLSLLILLAIWQVLADYLHSHTLPTPYVVALVFWKATVSGQLPYHLGVTLLRLIVSFSIAMLLGSAIGIVLGRSKTLNQFFDHWLVIFPSLPSSAW